MPDADSIRLAEAFVDHSLPESAWTHRAHLTVCWVALSTRSSSETIDWLRSSIRSYNEATGVANTTISGYHETITRYFVGAVEQVAAAVVEQLFDADSCRPDAPLRHWSRGVLFTPTARASWVEPDQADLPWWSSWSTSSSTLGDRISSPR
jgi:hypothetical protein